MTTTEQQTVHGPTPAAVSAGFPPGLSGGPAYLDHNATTPVDTRVVDAMLPYLHTHFGNPSSGHGYGDAPRAALARAREQVRTLIGATGGRVVLTGSGSESDALAVRGVVAVARAAGVAAPHVVSQVTEHPAVLAALRAVELGGARVTLLGVGLDGLVSVADLRALMTPETVLVSVMHANNETGVLQPVAELAAAAHEGGALLHTDAAQSAGKVPVDVAALGVDLLTLVGHKMYAPKGVGALWVAPDVELAPLVAGGGQEGGLRAGTENVANAVALGTAAELAAADLAAGEPQRLASFRDRLFDRLISGLPGRVELNGHPDHRLPHVLNVSIAGVRSHDVLDATTEFAASAGSACHAGEHTASPVLTAMGLPAERGLSAFRLSLGRWSTAADVDRTAEALIRAVSS